MSIVGLRPHAIGSQANNKFFWEVDRKYWQRHCLKPGLTGLAQVRGHRGATEREKDLTERLQSDLEYIAEWSLLRDIQIVLRTARVLSHHNAYWSIRDDQGRDCCQHRSALSRAFAVTRSFRMTAVMAILAGFPAVTSCWYLAFRSGL